MCRGQELRQVHSVGGGERGGEGAPEHEEGGPGRGELRDQTGGLAGGGEGWGEGGAERNSDMDVTMGQEALACWS